jgi:hypothetical protein
MREKLRLFRKVPKVENTVKLPTIVINKRIEARNGLAFLVGDDYYLVKNQKLLRFFSKRVFGSWMLDYVEVGPQALAHLRKSGVVGFRDGSLVKNFVDGKMYLVSDNKKCLVTNPDVVTFLGNRWIDASDAEINLHDDGEQIDGY